ncbi:uncharacterized protein LOC144825067 [Lissotriton helveticus]
MEKLDEIQHVPLKKKTSGGSGPNTSGEVETFRDPNSGNKMIPDQEKTYGNCLERYSHLAHVAKAYRLMTRKYTEGKGVGTWKSAAQRVQGLDKHCTHQEDDVPHGGDPVAVP